MRILLLNLPSSDKIQRRYMCSYNAPNMMLPPIEMLAIGGILKENTEAEVELIDAVAENLSFEETVTKLHSSKPDLIISLTGFESIEEEINTINYLKSSYSEAKWVLFGHYATLFCKEIVELTKVDFIVLDEPDFKILSLYAAINQEIDLKEVEGVYYVENGKEHHQKGKARIRKTEDLPMPAHELLKPNLYFEPFMPKPLGLIQSARGCPYSCNYCVKSFGKQLSLRTPQQVLEEVQFLIKNNNIKSLRFIDDTYTVNEKRVIDICKLFLENDVAIPWTCLSRPDTLSYEMIDWMKKANCKRIYFGVETASEKILEHYNKSYDLIKAKEIIQYCKKAGIETLGFFMIGTPIEEYSDVKKSISFAKKSGLTYIVVSKIAPYPGTEYFNRNRKDISFNLYPYNNEFVNVVDAKEVDLWIKKFYKSFYFNPSNVVDRIVSSIKSPIETIETVRRFGSYLLEDRLSKKRSDFI